MTTWADVKKGSVVELGGREWTVEKFKVDGKKAKVTVEHKGRTAKSIVKLKDRVKIVRSARVGIARAMREREAGKPPLHDDRGQAQRWATDRELRDAMGKSHLPAGDPAQTTPPAPAAGDVWETQADRTERMLGELLDARLVAVTLDDGSGSYVPNVGVSTVAAHLALFHGVDPSTFEDEGKMLEAHEREHATALRGEAALHSNHWHTERRP